MNIETREMGEFMIICPKEKSLNALNCSTLKSQAIDTIEKGNEKIILDLTNVEFIDTAGLGTIIGIYKMLSSKENFFISSPSPKTKVIFHYTGVDSIIKIFSSVEEAIASNAKKTV